MLISMHAGTGEIVSSHDETRFYDDVGCLAADWETHRRDATAYVRLADGRWTDAQSAVFARPSMANTAMGSGIVAYASKDEARAADSAGQVLTWNEVVTIAGERR